MAQGPYGPFLALYCRLFFRKEARLFGFLMDFFINGCLASRRRVSVGERWATGELAKGQPSTGASRWAGLLSTAGTLTRHALDTTTSARPQASLVIFHP